MGKKESIVENYLCTNVGINGGITRKMVWQGRKGAPDRGCFFPGGKLLMVETKAAGEKPEPLQIHEMETLRKLGFYVAWADTQVGIARILAAFHSGMEVAMFNAEFPL